MLDLNSRDSKLASAARDWVNGKKFGGVSFQWCCDSLDLDVDYLRRKIT